jgi:hypothetical protein
LAGNAIAAPYTWSFTTGIAPDTTRPTVSSTVPASNSTAFANAAISATFSEVLNAATVNSTTFTLNNGITGTVSYSGTTATFTPSASLAFSTTYTATITTGVQDLVGNALAPAYTWTFTTRVAPINDTGTTSAQCYQVGSNGLVACNSPGATGLNATQDGMVGRDANASTNVANDGKLGFSFTAVTGGCVLDNVTGLMWEVKTNDSSPGLRDWTKTYTNNLDGTSTDASGFVTAVNASNLCGFNNWRLPTVDELQSIVDYGATTGAKIDATWFPNTQPGIFWSASPYVANPAVAWYVLFSLGSVNGSGRTVANFVRLVHAGQ